jgi:hypothetical protein
MQKITEKIAQLLKVIACFLRKVNALQACKERDFMQTIDFHENISTIYSKYTRSVQWRQNRNQQ